MICVRSNFWELLQYLFPDISLMLNLPYVRLLNANSHQNPVPGGTFFSIPRQRAEEGEFSRIFGEKSRLVKYYPQ